MKKIAILLVLSFAFLLATPGCNEQQQQQIDKLADNIEAGTQAGQAFLDSPAGVYVPGDIRAVLEISGAIAMGLIVAWRNYRLKQQKTALEEVVIGNEMAKQNTQDANVAIKEAQAITQSAKTMELVAKIRAK